jgi:hypothetical protein
MRNFILLKRNLNEKEKLYYYYYYFLDNEGFLVEGDALVKGMTWIEICFFFNFLIILIC